MQSASGCFSICLYRLCEGQRMAVKGHASFLRMRSQNIGSGTMILQLVCSNIVKEPVLDQLS